MKPYIEVVGESKFIQTVQEYVADINIIVRATKSETAVNEAIHLRNNCIESLLLNGLQKSEIKEGGIEIWRDWFARRKQKPGKEASQKIIVTCEDIARLVPALSAIEPLFENQRYTFTVIMRQPVFNASEELREKAKIEAIQNAISHAQILAKTANIEIKYVFQIEEISKITGNSGVYGDAVGGGWMMMGLAAEDSSDDYESYANLDKATRNVKVRYRVRFSVKAK
ncbi:MAG: SIMPL domain-containing protein [Cyanobacteriota bacterium]|nr:SIMPL domain-containing protein [Cyanobacteriota bacterium]